MATAEEWQQKLDQDFPNGARFYRSDWIDPWDNTPQFRYTTGLHVVGVSNGLPVVLVMDADDDDYGWRISILSYKNQKSESGWSGASVRSQDDTWFFFDAVPDNRASSEEWKTLRKQERKAAQEMGASL